MTTLESNLWSNLQSDFTLLFEKYKSNQNTLLSAIIYSVKILDPSEIELIRLVLQPYLKYDTHDNSDIQGKLEEQEKHDSIKRKFLFSGILNFLSIKIIFNLPHMLHKTLCNNNITSHIIYGESITQLVSFCLLIEGSTLINEIFSIKPELLKDLSITILENKEVILTQNKEEVTKQDIYKDYYEKLQFSFQHLIKQICVFYTIPFHEESVNKHILTQCQIYFNKYKY
jgi:hypothetical protein